MTTNLLACDLDGTIIFDRAMRDTDRQALERWKAAGNLLVSATGKSVFGASRVLDKTGLVFDYHVLYSGAVVTDGKYTVLMDKGIPDDLFADVLEPLLTMPNVAAFGTTLTNDYAISNNTGEVADLLPAFDPLSPDDVPLHHFIGLALFINDEALINQLQEDLTAKYGTVLDCHRNQNFLDIVHAGSSKGSGLAWLMANPLRGKSVRTYSIGDSWNDIDMHEWSDHSATFGYAPKVVQDKCELVVDNVGELVNEVMV